MMKLCGSLPSNSLVKCRKDVDSLWSWLVCFCATFIIALTLGTSLNFGILFPVLMDHFQETRERTAWIGSIGLAFIFTLGSVTSVLVNRFGCRATTLIGGLFCICGLLLSSLASHIAVLYLTYSVLFGFGSSCMFVSCYLVISQYFEKKRSIATGIIASGSGFGVIAMAPILQALINSFGWKKTYRIAAGIFSVVVVLGFSFDPVILEKDTTELNKFHQEKKEPENSQELKERIRVKPKRRFIEFSAFKEKKVVVLTLCQVLFNLGHTIPRIHLVKFSEDLNIAAGAASRLFMFVGITTCIGRLLSGFICNMHRVNPIFVYMFGLILGGSSLAYLCEAKSYGDLIAFSFLYGMADGVVIGTFYICILNSVEASKKASAFGLSALFYGPIIATSPALAGFMADHLSSYTPSFILGAVSEFVAAALLLILVFDKKKTHNFHPVKDRGDGDPEHRGAVLWETSL